MNNQRGSYTGHGANKGQEVKSKLAFEVVHEVVKGNVKLSISRAMSQRGPVYSFTPSGLNPNTGSLTKFIRSNEIDNLIDVSRDAKLWIQADAEEFKVSRDNRRKSA